MGLHVWVSNHGGRISDSIRTSVEMLPECVMGVKEAGNSSIEVYVDGGIRKGSDVLKCIALGARCVFIGRN
jgi:isopentenyl diphosphate isomerase/L-lactate dehydrogenase-like FMN-dependent dehydrogenase